MTCSRMRLRALREAAELTQRARAAGVGAVVLDRGTVVHSGAAGELLYDRGLRVDVSARPLASWGALGRRLAMAYRTFSLDFGEEPPLARLRRRRRWRKQADARGLARPVR